MVGGNIDQTARWWHAVAFAAVLLLAQSLAVAHYHPHETDSRYKSSVAVSYDDGLCALCLFHQHSPSVSGAALFLVVPLLIEHVALYAAQSWALYSFSSYLSGRSPPLPAFAS